MSPATTWRWGFRRVTIDAGSSVGAALLDARRRAGRSAREYALALGVPERYLRALEEEDLSVLPGLVYEKHMLRRYALSLGLDAPALVAAWTSLRQEHDGRGRAGLFVPRLTWQDLWVSPAAVRRLASLAAILLVGGYLSSRLVVMVQPPPLTVLAPPPDASTTARTIEVVGLTAPESTVTVNAHPVPIRSDGSFQAVVTLDLGLNAIRVVAIRRYSQASSVERQVFVVAPGPSADVRLSTSRRPSP